MDAPVVLFCLNATNTAKPESGPLSSCQYSAANEHSARKEELRLDFIIFFRMPVLPGGMWPAEKRFLAGHTFSCPSATVQGRDVWWTSKDPPR